MGGGRTLDEEELLSVEDVASYLGVGPVTVYRWCRRGSLPCLKIARRWRIRRSTLEEFLERTERSTTLVGRLRAFLEMPASVLAIAQSVELMYRLDAAFFQVAEARGAALIKYHRSEAAADHLEDLRAGLKRHGLEVSRLEERGRLRFVAERDLGERVGELRRLAAEEADSRRPLWVNFDWEERLDLDTALRHQEEITDFVGDSQFVVKTSLLEETLDVWSGATQRRAHAHHGGGTIWLSGAGLSLSPAWYRCRRPE
jgi:excisionase family DNA binding protein